MVSLKPFDTPMVPSALARIGKHMTRIKRNAVMVAHLFLFFCFMIAILLCSLFYFYFFRLAVSPIKQNVPAFFEAAVFGHRNPIASSVRIPLPGSGRGLSLFGCHLFQCDLFRLHRDGNIFCCCLVILGGFESDGDVGLSRSSQGHESSAVYAGDSCHGICKSV